MAPERAGSPLALLYVCVGWGIAGCREGTGDAGGPRRPGWGAEPGRCWWQLCPQAHGRASRKCASSLHAGTHAFRQVVLLAL